MEILVELDDTAKTHSVSEALEFLLDDINGIRGYDYGADDKADIVIEVEVEPGAAGTALVGVETFQERLSCLLDEWAETQADISDISVV